MNRKAKLALKMGGIVVGLVILIVVVAVIWIDELAVAAIESGGESVLGVTTTLEEASIGIFSGRFGLKGLVIGNPEGFKSPFLLRMGEGETEVSLGSLLSDKIEIQTLELSDLHLNLEKRGGTSNYKEVLKNLETEEESPEEEPGSTKELVIREIVIRNVSVTADLLPVGGSLSRVTLAVPELRFSNIGQESSVTIGEVIGRILQEVLAAAFRAGKGVLPDEMLTDLGGTLEGMGDRGLDLGGQIGGRVGEAIGDAGEALGGIFGGKKRK